MIGKALYEVFRSGDFVKEVVVDIPLPGVKQTVQESVEVMRKVRERIEAENPSCEAWFKNWVGTE